MRASVGQAITGRSSAGDVVMHSGYYGTAADQNSVTPAPSPVDPTPSSTASASPTVGSTASPTSGPTSQPTNDGQIYLPSLQKDFE